MSEERAKAMRDILAYRLKHFAVKTEPTKDPEAPGEIVLSVTRNGFQWTSISLLPSEVKAVVETLSKSAVLIAACLLLIGCRTSPQMPADAFEQMVKTNSEFMAPALMSPSTRAEADALMRPKNLMDRASGARGVPSARRIVNANPEPASIMPALTSRVVTHPPPVAITNVTVTWSLEPMPAILQSIQGPAGNVHPVTFLVASTNGWSSQYQVTPDMTYAASNGVVRRMIQNEQFRAGYEQQD